MRFITGPIGVIAAAVFVGYSAVITWNVAHNMTTEFQELAGWAAAGVVLWECLGLLYVRQCWHNGSRILAIGGFALVLAAAVYTARLDLRFHVAGQSDMAASREASVENRKMTREELAKARAQRDTLQARRKLTGFEREELESLTTRIAALESKFDTQIVNAGGMPEAGWASRMLGSISEDEVWWQDALMVFGLVFWALARMLAMPLAVASMASIRKPVAAATAAKDDPAILTGTKFSPPVLPYPVRQERRALDGTLEKLTGAKANLPEIPVSSAPAQIGRDSPNLAPVEPKLDTPTAWASEEELQKLRELVAEMKAAESTSSKAEHVADVANIAPKADVANLQPDPTGPGTPVAKPEEPATEEVAEDAKIVRPAQWHDESVPPVAPRTNGKRSKRNLTRKDQIVIQWLGDCCSITGDERDVTTGAACHASYKQYCDGRRIPEKDRVAQARMSTILSGHLDTRVNGRGKRKNQGAVFTGLLINPTVAQRRKVA